MFTGIVEETGIVKKIEPQKITIQTTLSDLKLGESISVNGICLTIVENILLSGTLSLISVEVMPETIKKTTLSEWRIGAKINLERALAVTGRLNGHIVSGHIDGIGIIKKLQIEENAKIVTISAEDKIIKHLVPKGSIAIDGISLTVVDVKSNRFSVSLIPYTIKETTLNLKKENDKVNLETDILAKYVEKMLESNINSTMKKELTKESLEKYGFT